MNPLLTTFLGKLPEDIDSALLQDPHSCDLWNAKGCDDYAARDFRNALNAFTHAITLSDQYHHYIHYECAATFIARALWFFASSDWVMAKKDLEAALFQDHGSKTALLLRLWLARYIEKDRTSEQKYSKQAERYGHTVTMPATWQEIPAYDRALASDSAWQKAILLPGHKMFTSLVSDHDHALQYMKSDPAEAARLLRKVLHHPRAWRHYGMALQLAGQAEDAKAALDEAIIQHKQWHDAYHRAAASHRLNRAISYEALNEYLLAWQEASKAQDIDKDWELAMQEKARLANQVKG